jgi:hypothetical protein
MVGMFAGEKCLTLSVVAVVGAAGCLIDFTSVDEFFGGVVFTFWLWAAAGRECLPHAESADLGLANPRPRGVTKASSARRSSHHWVRRACRFGWSVLLIAIATFIVLCIAFAGPRSMRSGSDLDAIGIIGIILLIGIVKKNGIMLVDFALVG